MANNGFWGALQPVGLFQNLPGDSGRIAAVRR